MRGQFKIQNSSLKQHFNPPAYRSLCKPLPPNKRPVSCNSSQKPDSKDVGVGLKAVWFGAEALGNLIGAGKQTDNNTASTSSTRLTREEAISLIKMDYDTNYFISGKGGLEAYDPQCEFADPFASFRGVQRFKTNVGNLGGLLRDVQLDITSWEETGDTLNTKWRFSAILDLAWKPKLAAAGGTTHVFDENNRVVKHIESWDIEPSKVISNLLKPSAKVPSSQAEVFMTSLGEGDLLGVLLSLTGFFVKFSGAALVVSLPWRLVTGESMPGTAVFGAMFVASLVTEIVKIAKGMQGGETGTGGRF